MISQLIVAKTMCKSMLMLTPLADATNGDSTTITLTTTSQGDETQTTELSTLIVVEGGSFTIHLPLITN